MTLPAYTQQEALDLVETAYSVGFREAIAFMLEVAATRPAQNSPETMTAWLKSLIQGWPPGHRTEDLDDLVGLIRNAHKIDPDRLALAFRVKGLGELWMERGKDVVRSGKAIQDEFTIGEGTAMQRCGDVLLRSLGPKERG